MDTTTNNIRKCKTCETVLVQRAHESSNRFRGKRYCSSSCARKDIKANNRGYWAYRTSTPNSEIEAGRRAYLASRGGDSYIWNQEND